MISIDDLKIALIFLSLFLLWALIHSFLASLTAKKLAGRILGRYYAFYRLAYVTLSALSFAALWFFAPRPQGSIYYIGGVWFIILKGIQTLALIGFLFAGSQFNMEEFLGFLDISKYFSVHLEPRQPEPLNTGGYFAYVRHPLYLFGMIILWSDPEMTVWWFTISVAITIYLVIGTVFEERKLIAIYGDQYREYRRTVRRFLPIKRRVER